MRKRRQNYQNIAWFYDVNKRGLLDLDPPFQRRSVWNQTYREQFIDTILMDHPAPALFLYGQIDTFGTTTYQVVDGKQRLSTIISFMEGAFAVSESSDAISFRGKYFKDFSEDERVNFFEYDFSVEYLPTNDESAISSIFDRLNRNVVKLTSQELRHAKFSGHFIQTAEDLSDTLNQRFEQFPYLTYTSRRQMKDVEIVAALLLLIENGPKGLSAIQLDEAFSDRDESWDKKSEVVGIFNEVLTALEELRAANPTIVSTRLKNQADYYSLFGAIAELKKERAYPNDPGAIADRLLNFVALLNDDLARAGAPALEAYHQAARAASNDTSPRQKRIDVIKQVILGVRFEDIRL